MKKKVKGLVVLETMVVLTALLGTLRLIIALVRGAPCSIVYNRELTWETNSSSMNAEICILRQNFLG